MLDARRFQRCWQALQARGDSAPIFTALKRAYSEPQRAYHNAQHLEDCLHLFDQVRDMAAHPELIEAALWYHDAVYDPRANDNEARSATWAARDLHQARVSPRRIDAIDELIMATKHDGTPETPDAALLVDIDLAILGRTPDEFDHYDRAIRAEYAWVPEEIYTAGRSAVLERFLARPKIYATPWFQARYEAAARRNLERVLKQLMDKAGQI